MHSPSIHTEPLTKARGGGKTDWPSTKNKSRKAVRCGQRMALGASGNFKLEFHQSGKLNTKKSYFPEEPGAGTNKRQSNNEGIVTDIEQEKVIEQNRRAVLDRNFPVGCVGRTALSHCCMSASILSCLVGVATNGTCRTPLTFWTSAVQRLVTRSTLETRAWDGCGIRAASTRLTMDEPSRSTACLPLPSCGCTTRWTLSATTPSATTGVPICGFRKIPGFPNSTAFRDFRNISKTAVPICSPFPTFQEQQPDEQSSRSSTWHAAYRYAFHTSDTSLGDLTTPTALLVLLGLVLAFRHVKAVLCPCFSATGRRVARLTHGEDWIHARHNQVRITKFGEYVFRLLYHLAISIYGIWYFHDKEWWQKGNTVAVFSGFPYHSIEPGMAWYYLLQSAYNLDAFWSLLELSFVIKIRSVRKKGGLQLIGWQSPIAIEWSPSVRGDFQEMMVHHVATNLLVLGSSLFRFTRIGSSKSRHRSFANAVLWLLAYLQQYDTAVATPRTHALTYIPHMTILQWSFWCTIFPMFQLI